MRLLMEWAPGKIPEKIPEKTQMLTNGPKFEPAGNPAWSQSTETDRYSGYDTKTPDN